MFHCIAFDLIEFIQANYTITVQITATQVVVFHLWSQFEMLYKSRGTLHKTSVPKLEHELDT